jgi:hypothetical protein
MEEKRGYERSDTSCTQKQVLGRTPLRSCGFPFCATYPWNQQNRTETERSLSSGSVKLHEQDRSIEDRHTDDEEIMYEGMHMLLGEYVGPERNLS